MRHVVATQTIVAPAAGADISFVPSSSDRVLLLAMTAKLVTSATASNRRPAIELASQNGDIYFSADAGYPQAASLTAYYSWARGGPTVSPANVVAGQRVAVGLPWLRLQPGDTVSTITAGIESGDQWSSIAWRGIVSEHWEDEEELSRIDAYLLALGG